jgi:hypothetical protein
MKRWLTHCLIALMLSVPLLAPLPVQATVNSSVNKTTVLGNGAQTQFAFSFIGVASAYISVIFTDASGNQIPLTQGSGATQYQITLNAPVQGAIWGIGGTVTYNPGGSPIANGTTLTIFRTLPLTQAISLQNKTSLTALGNGAETGIDLGVMLDQQSSEQLARAITAPIGDPPTINLVLPTAAQRANTGLAFDSQGNVIAGTIPATGLISSAMQPVVNAASLAAGRTAFGLGSAATLSPNCQLLSNASGAGKLDVGAALTQVAINQAVTASFCGQTYVATGPISFTLPRANTLWNGFGFWIHVLGSGGSVTLPIDSHDTIEGLSSGISGTLLLNSWAFITTDAAASGNWRISIASNYPGIGTLTGNNLVRNSGLGLVTNVATTFVGVTPGQPISLSGWAQQGGAGSGNARFNSTSSFIAGLQPGKLVAIMGFSNTINLTATVSGGNTITATGPIFTGAVGDLLWNTGGTNHSSKSQWRIASISGCSGACTTVVVQGALVNEAGVTFTSMQQIQGGYALADQTVNGMPQGGNPNAQAFPYYTLQVTAVGANFFNAQLAGHNLNIGTPSSGTAWEVTNGSMGTGCIGPDWWSCTATLSFFKMRGTDWDGVTVVNKPGSLYSAKLIKGATTQELFYQDLQASAPATVDIVNYTGLANFQGKTVTCGAYIKAPNANEGRLFINDGIAFTYGPFVTPGSFQWTEVTATLSAVATTSQSGMSMDTGSVGDAFIFTQPICKFGSGVIGAGNYQPAPPAFHMFKVHTTPFYYVNANVPANALINIEQETSGCLPSGMESVQADIGGANTGSVPQFLQLSDSPGPPQMSALVGVSPTNSASQSNNQTGQVAISRRGSGDGQFNLDTQWINVNGSSTWTRVTVDYLGGFY